MDCNQATTHRSQGSRQDAELQEEGLENEGGSVDSAGVPGASPADGWSQRRALQAQATSNATANVGAGGRRSERYKIDKKGSSSSVEQQAICFGVSVDNLLLLHKYKDKFSPQFHQYQK